MMRCASWSSSSWFDWFCAKMRMTSTEWCGAVGVGGSIIGVAGARAVLIDSCKQVLCCDRRALFYCWVFEPAAREQWPDPCGRSFIHLGLYRVLIIDINKDDTMWNDLCVCMLLLGRNNDHTALTGKWAPVKQSSTIIVTMSLGLPRRNLRGLMMRIFRPNQWCVNFDVDGCIWPRDAISLDGDCFNNINYIFTIYYKINQTKTCDWPYNGLFMVISRFAH